MIHTCEKDMHSLIFIHSGMRLMTQETSRVQQRRVLVNEDQECSGGLLPRV